MTYSIVALDPDTGELGVAVQSRWFSVGSVVPWLEPGVGAVATQSFAEVAHGYNGVRLLREGRTPDEALAEMLRDDENEAMRQLGIVDAQGRSAAHTGSGCIRFASHVTAAGVSAQANMMERSTVPTAMLEAFGSTRGDLADRLLAALFAAEGEGGDVRGRQSAALVVVPGPDADGNPPKPWARTFDLHIEDHRAPLQELSRVLQLARAYLAFDEAETAYINGDNEAALKARRRTVELAPDDDQVVLWGAVTLAVAGHVDEAREALARASAVEPRAAEHLRRFAEAGQLHGGDETLRALGIEPA
jgi:uncharacterized Ntn-hydrolase superfamily protein